MKTIQSVLTIFCAAVLISLVAPQTRAQVVNGGFETGTSTTAPPWVIVDSSNFTGFGTDPSFAHSGSRYSFLGSTSTIGTLTQAINTIAGAPYQLSFWLANDGGLPPNSFQALFNGITLVSLTNSPGFRYTQFLANFIGTGAPADLQFRNRNDQDFWRLDDVSVTLAAVPELGATAWLALPAFTALLLLHFRLRRAPKRLS